MGIPCTWYGGRDASSSTFGAPNNQNMNPIAFIAFLMGINTTTPPAKPAASEQEQHQEKPTQGKDKGNGHPKRGGWDRN